MASQTTNVLYVVPLVATIVAVDVLFFKHLFWERLSFFEGQRGGTGEKKIRPRRPEREVP
jgi:hypothetical protein